VSASTRALRDFAEADLPALIDLWAAGWTATGIPTDFDARRAWIGERLWACSIVGRGMSPDSGPPTLKMRWRAWEITTAFTVHSLRPGCHR
jgi:hypothetical protein